MAAIMAAMPHAHMLEAGCNTSSAMASSLLFDLEVFSRVCCPCSGPN